ncbi:MAG: MMPL family transporter [Propionibacteriaceae bacterium]
MRRLVSRGGAWVALALALVLFGGLSVLFRGAQAPSAAESAPAGSESVRAAELLDTFPGADTESLLLVVTRTDGTALTEADLADATTLAEGLANQTGHDAGRVAASADQEAALVPLPITPGADNTETSETVKALRATIADEAPEGLTVQVTGGPAFGADIAASFDGADIALLLTTIAIVAVLLGLTYRSPILWLVPVAVVGLADQAAALITAALGERFELQFDAGVISVLVFGAGTNYAMLLISRYREELRREPDHRTAMSTAWRHTAPAVLASNLTVVVALATLVFAVIPGTRGLGIAAAAGLLVALLAVLFVLPSALVVCGRRVFWPMIPRVGDVSKVGLWQRLAQTVVRKPIRVLAAGLALVALMISGLATTSVGLTQTERFRVASESAEGLTVLAEHFPAGEAQPHVVLTRTGEAEAVQERIDTLPGVIRVHPVDSTGDGPESWTHLMVVGESGPGTPESLALVQSLRDEVHAVDGADALVGGPVAVDVDARAGAEADLALIVPLVLGVCLVVLIVLLRSLLAPVLLLVINIASTLGAIGAGSVINRWLFGLDALDLQVPLLAFLFLVALGIDYTIFLTHRARNETAVHGTRAGMVRAVAHTGGVITGAGIVLAGVFAALGILPLVTLGQLGLIVGIGVVVDTCVVRTMVVPALFGLIGDRIWWPGRPQGDTSGPEAGQWDGVDRTEVQPEPSAPR